MKTVISVLTLVTLAATPVTFAAVVDGSFYVVASIAESDTDYRLDANDVIDGDDTGWHLGAGFNFSKRFAVEANYHDFGAPTGFAGCPPEVFCVAAFAAEPVDVTGWSLQLVGNLPIGYELSLLGKLGGIAWDTDAFSPSLDDSGTNLIYGAGINWDASDRIALQASYEAVDLDIDTLKLGMLFRF